LSTTIILEVTFREDDVAPVDMLFAAESALQAEPTEIGLSGASKMVWVSRVRVHTCPTTLAAAAGCRAPKGGT
jgi:hypothetical protein